MYTHTHTPINLRYFGEGGRPGESRPCRFYYAQRREKRRSSSSSSTTTSTTTYERFAANIETFRDKQHEHVIRFKTLVQKHTSCKDELNRVIDIIDRCWNYTIWIRIMIWSVSHHTHSPQIVYLRLVLMKLHYRLEDLIRDVESCLMNNYSIKESALEHVTNKSGDLIELMGSVLNRLSERMFCDDKEEEYEEEEEKTKDKHTTWICLSCGESNQNESCCKSCTSSYDSSIESFVKRSFELESSVVAVLNDERMREEKIRTKISDRTTQQDKVWIPGTCTACTFSLYFFVCFLEYRKKLCYITIQVLFITMPVR